MLTDKQLAARIIGGSDVGVIMGYSPHKTPFELYHEKRGTIAPEDFTNNMPVAAGNAMESGIAILAELFMTRATGKQVQLREVPETLVRPEYPWLTCHIDRVVLDEPRGVELKNTSWRMESGWGEQHTDDIPTYHLAQVHTYLMVTDLPVFTVAAYFGGADLRLYEVHRNRGWDNAIIDATYDFHEQVVKGIPPPAPKDNPRALDIIKRVYPGTNGFTMQAGPAEEMYRKAMFDAAERHKSYEALADAAKAHLLWEMRDNARMEFADGTALERKKIEKKGFEVAPCSYISATWKKAKA